MSKRQEIRQRQREKIEEFGVLPISRRGARNAEDNLLKATRTYERALNKFTEYQQALVYGVGIFGSARIEPGTPEYEFAKHLGKGLVQARNVHIITGGGPGLMEAPVEGASEAITEAKGNGKVITSKRRGYRIELPFEEGVSPNLDSIFTHEHFGTRLAHFEASTQAAIFLPGGIGSDLELDWFIQLFQVGHLEPEFPIIVHPSYRKAIEERYAEKYTRRIEQGVKPTISKADFTNIIYSDDPEQIINIISQGYDNWFDSIRSHVRRTR